MKRTSIIGVLSLLISLIGVVAGAAPASASEGPLRLVLDALGYDSRNQTLTYGENLVLSASAYDNNDGCVNYPHNCTNPTGTVDFWEQPGDAWVDGGTAVHTKLNGDNALIPFVSEIDPNEDTGIASADGGFYCCLSPGRHTLRAFYVPGNFDATSDDAIVDVNKATPTISLEQSSTSSKLGEAVTLTASISRVANRLADGPTGSVTFAEGDPGHVVQYGTATVGTDGKASITTSLIPGGSHTIRAVYTGDTNYASGDPVSVTHTVDRAATTSALSASPTSIMFGQPIAFTTTVSPVGTFTVKPTGTVNLVGSYLSKSGSLDTSSPPKSVVTSTPTQVGTQTVTASYQGDANFAGSTSNSVTLNVAKAHTTTTVITSGSPSTLGQSVTFTAGVVGDYNTAPTGTVQFKDGSSDLGALQTLFSGQATLTVAGLTGGNHTITAVYAGDSNHDGSTSGSLTQTVTCDRVVSGSVSAVAASGTTCLSGATVSGNVSVPAGAKLSLVNSHVSGVISTASGAGPITICGTSVGGNVTITGASGFVLIGDTVEDACAANSLGGSVTLSSNSGGLQVGFNRIGGNVTVSNNVGAGPAPAHSSPEIEANRIGGSLSCSGNSPVASDDGRPNSVSGARGGECASKTF